jgi:hypothetical protein
MPEMHKLKGKAKDFNDGGRKGRGRCARHSCSWFVLLALAALGCYHELSAVCPKLSEQRERVTAATRKDTAAHETCCSRYLRA